MGRIALMLLPGLLVCACDRAMRRTLPVEVGSIVVGRSGTRGGDSVVLLSPRLHEALRRAFRLDGRLVVRDEGQDADCLLNVTLVEYSKTPARFNVNNIVQEYRVRMVLDLSLSNLSGKEVLWATGPPSGGSSVRRVERATSFVVIPASGVSVETEEDAQRRLLRDISRDAVLKVIEGR